MMNILCILYHKNFLHCYMLLKELPLVCIENTVEGVCQEINTYYVFYVTHALVGDPCYGLLCSLLIGNILHISQVPLRINTKYKLGT